MHQATTSGAAHGGRDLRGRARFYLAVVTALQLSESIYDLVFANLAYGVSGHAISVATTYAIGYGSEILVTVFGAGFLDRFSRRKIFVFTQLAMFAVFSCIAIAASRIELDMAAIWSFTFVVDLLYQYSRLTAFTLVVSVFGAEERAGIAGASAMIDGLGRIAGPALAGGLIASMGRPGAVGASAALQLAAFAGTVALLRAAPDERGVEALRDRRSGRARAALAGVVRAGREIMAAERWRAFVLLDAVSVLPIAVAALLWVPLLRNLHGVLETETGIFMATGALGTVLGGMVVRRSQSPGTGRLLGAALGFAGLSLALSVARSSRVLAGASIFAFNAAVTTYLRRKTVALQAAIPEDRAGAWYGAIDALSRLMGLAGILTTGMLFDRIGPRALFTGLAAAIIALAFIWARHGRLDRLGPLDRPPRVECGLEPSS